ncbi:MAG: Fur family transcriptional regulator [Planctomycetota bacterium]
MTRNTRQREAIRRAFREHRRPLSAEEVLKYARRRVPRLGIATVYRNLGALREEGWLKPVRLPGRRVLHERRRKRHHHFFLCRDCNRCFGVSFCPRSLRRYVPRGHVVEDHELVLYGVCRDCAGA